MDTQLSFLRTKKKRDEDPSRVRILALTYNLAGFDALTALLEIKIPNSRIFKGLFGTEGITKVRSTRPDIILMEWRADDTSCIAFLKNLKTTPDTGRIPLIVFTKEPSDQKIRASVLELGASGFLEGPIGEEELAAQVKTLLEIRKEKEHLHHEKARLENLVSESEERLQERTKNLDKRVKELNCLYRISELRERPGISLEALLQGVADLIPSAWQRPETICARILLGYQVFTTDHFKKTPWKLARDIMVNGEWAGTLEVFYLERPERDEDLFPKEETSMITIIAERLGRIAERVRAEESLKFESENITKILKSMEDRVYIVNQQYDMEYINPALKKEFGPNDGKKCYTYFRNRKEPCTGCRIEDVFKGKTVRLERHYPRIRRTYDVVETPLRNKDGSLSKLAIYRDVTALKQAQKALEEREALYRSVTESIADGAVMVQDGKVMLVNHALVEMFGYGTPRELTGIEVIHLFDRDFRGLFQRFFDPKEQGEEFEDLLRGVGVTKSGKKFWISTHRSVIDLKSKPAILATMRDITEDMMQEESVKEVTEHLRRENIKLRSSIKERYRFGNIIGKSLPMQEVYELILQAAGSDANVIILGESGTGKELVARAIHDMSSRSDKGFVPVNCGAIPENLVESEFFGHRRGAFTGAHIDKTGYLHSADEGTLFLDEIGELGLNIQVKLLRALERGEYAPVGDTRLRKSGFRVISATNRDFSAMVTQGLIREDFFYRISVLPIQLPPLKDKKEDIPLLIEHFLKMYVKGKKIPAIPGKIMEILYNHDWPGNVRELQSVIQRYLAVGNFDFLTFNGKEEMKPLVVDAYRPSNVPDLREAVERFEKDFILSVLNHNQWHRGKAANALGIDPKTLYTKMKKIGLS
jgi:PAS domain S-box-containing protein